MADGKVYTYAVAMPDYYGIDHGLPMPGDLEAVVVSDVEPVEMWPGLIWVEGT